MKIHIWTDNLMFPQNFFPKYYLRTYFVGGDRSSLYLPLNSYDPTIWPFSYPVGLILPDNLLSFPSPTPHWPLARDWEYSDAWEGLVN